MHHTTHGSTWILAAILAIAALASCQFLEREPAVTQAVAELPTCPEPVCPEPVCPTSPSLAQKTATQDTAPTQTTTQTKDGGTITININTASTTQLTTLSGIGPKMAERIVKQRERKPFRTTRDLMRVKGIGHSKWSALKTQITTK